MPAGSSTITFGTLNLCGLPPRPPVRPLAERAPHLLPRLDALPVDVLNLQEVWFYPSLRLLRSGLRSYPHVRYSRGPVGPAGGLVTFSRLPLRRPSYRPFVAIRPPSAGPPLGHTGAPSTRRFGPRRAVLGAVKGVLTVDLAEHPVTVVNAHLTANRTDRYVPGNRFYDFQHAQLARLDALLSRPRGTDLTVLTGDLNVPSTCAAYPLIVGHGRRRDPFAATDPPTFPVASPWRRLDYVLIDGDETRYPVRHADTFFGHPVVVDGTDLYLSDHVGLTVQIGLGPHGA